MIKKIFVLLTVVLNLMLPLNVFAKEEVTDLKNTQKQENIDLEKGQGSIVETTKDNSKEFFTIMTENGATFYLVVDKNRGSENVYFLKTVDEVDLMKLAGGNAVIFEETTQATTQATTETTSIETVEEVKQEKKSSFGFFEIFAILGLVFLICFLIYDKFFKGKAKNSSFDDEDFEEEEQELKQQITEEDLDGFINKKID